MPKGVYERPAKAEPKESNSMSEAQMFPVVLNKNYAPRDKFEIVGYQRAAVERKDSAGKMLVVEPAAFVEGEMKPAPYPGVGFDNKIWAGTTIRLPLDEAKTVVAKKIAERADVIAA
jgi:hypothetical protein